MTAQAAHPLIGAYFEHRAALGRFLQARLGASGDVEDLLQDLYLKVAALDPAIEVRDARAFLYRLASNQMMDRWRSGQRSVARDAAWRLANHAVGETEDLNDAPSAEAVVIGRQKLAALTAAVSRLPDKTRTVFSLHKFEGFSYAEVAGRLGISRSSVEKHMMDALRVLSARIRS
ncbi:MAG TPA: RNA polymerase sigma factor [Brevundimonas sp.]